MKAAAAFTFLATMVTLSSGRADAAKRVVFCASTAGACGAALRTFGKVATGSWGVVDDSSLIETASKTTPLPPVLYFTVAAYNEATAGLHGKDIERAVLDRLRAVKDQLAVTLLSVLRDDAFQLALASSDEGSGDKGSDLDVALDLGVVLGGGPDRYSDQSVKAVLNQVQESLAKLRVELPSGSGAQAGYREEAEALADYASAPRAANGVRLYPFAAPHRVYFIPGEKAPQGFDGELPELSAYGWHGGSVTVMRPDEVSAAKGRRPHLVYYSDRLFEADRALIPAQLDQRLRARLRRIPPREQAQLVAALAFDHAIELRQYEPVIRKKAPDAIAGWTAAVSSAPAGLRLTLAAAHDPKTDARSARAQLRADMAFATFAIHSLSLPDPNQPTIERAAAIVARLPNEN